MRLSVCACMYVDIFVYQYMFACNTCSHVLIHADPLHVCVDISICTSCRNSGYPDGLQGLVWLLG
jgi:hypothetical protein